jgi:multidrug efflux pump subunit AcrA (membrane-fusion protein)
MRSVRAVLFWLCFLAVIAAVVWGSFMMKEHFGHEPEEEEHAEAEKPSALDDEAIERMGLEVTPLAAASWKERTEGFGRVVDPSPLAALSSERHAAEAAVRASEAEVERSRKLVTSENVARKALEQAELTAAADHIKLQAARQRFLLEWGPAIEKDSDTLIEELLSGKTILIRAEPASAALPDKPPSAAHVTVPGHSEPIAAAVLAPAPLVDAKSQSLAWFLKLEKPAFALPPGLSLAVDFEEDGKEESGVLIPAKAVLYFQGTAWVFVPGEEKGHFERKPVSLEHPLKGGWFAAEEFKPGDKVVTAGAASLLAEELKSQIEGD